MKFPNRGHKNRVGFYRMFDYKGVRLLRFHCIIQVQVLARSPKCLVTLYSSIYINSIPPRGMSLQPHMHKRSIITVIQKLKVKHDTLYVTRQRHYCTSNWLTSVFRLLYTLNLCPTFLTTSLKQSGPGHVANAATIAGPFISSSKIIL